MSEILAKDREIAVTGQILAKGMDYLPGGAAFRENDNLIAGQVGLVNISGKVVRLIPLSGRYVPKVGDLVIGKVIDMSFSNWFVEIGYAYEAALSIRDVPEYVEKNADLARYYNFDDMIVAQVVKVTKAMKIDLSMKDRGLGKLLGGRFIFITPNKVPRVIGKSGSMVDMIKQATNCRIMVGQNGRIWIKGDNDSLVVEAIRKVEELAHISGLTDKIDEFLTKRLIESGKKV